MVTIFTVPKPFRGHIGIIQKNAIQSWCRLRPECEVILFGNDEGIAKVAAEFNIRHMPDIARNEYGTPLLDSVFSLAQQHGSHRLMAYINADIILMSDFLQAASQVKLDRFLMLGQRWDLDITELLDFDDPGWESHLRSVVFKRGCLHPPGGVDYYLFPRGLFGEIPPFAIGRTAYDNWLIFKARLLGVPVIDATQVVTCIHQNHERTYTSVGLKGPEGGNDLTKGPERARNIELMGGKYNSFTLEYATLLLTPQGLRPASTLAHRYFHLRTIPVLHPRLHYFILPFRVFEKFLIPIQLIMARLRRYRRRI